MNPLVTALAPLPPSIWMRPRATGLPFPLGRLGCALFARARHGLWHGLAAAGLSAGDEVLAPAYHHGSEIEALRRAGLECRFYEVTETLEPNENELRRLVGPRTRALHLTHFLGFPQDARRWRRWCDERGLLLIEDAAQAWLAEREDRPVGSDGDLAIFCLYKTFGLPDGAAVVSRTPRPHPGARSRRLGAGAVAFDHALWVVCRSALLSRLAERAYRRRPYVPADDFALGDAASSPAATTLLALPRVARSDAAARRRRNYRYLLVALGHLVPAAFRVLPPGASPFVFPVVAADKPLLLRRLRARGVRAVDLWSVPHPSLPDRDFPGAAALRERVVGLPTHQELGERDLAAVVTAILDS